MLRVLNNFPPRFSETKPSKPFSFMGQTMCVKENIYRRYIYPIPSTKEFTTIHAVRISNFSLIFSGFLKESWG